MGTERKTSWMNNNYKITAASTTTQQQTTPIMAHSSSFLTELHHRLNNLRFLWKPCSSLNKCWPSSHRQLIHHTKHDRVQSPLEAARSRPSATRRAARRASTACASHTRTLEGQRCASRLRRQSLPRTGSSGLCRAAKCEFVLICVVCE